MGLSVSLIAGITLAIAALLVFGMGLGRHKELFLLLLGVLVFFPDQTSWGATAVAPVFNIYSKGSGLLTYFSFTTVYLWGLYFLVLFHAIFRREQLPYCNIRRFLWAFNLLLCGHVIAGMVLNAPLLETLSGKGVINIFHMSVLLLLALRVVQDERDLDRLTDFLLVCALLRGGWGLVRFLFFGGDPVNVYSNVEEFAVKITFYDITDSLVACVGAFFAASRLSTGWRDIGTVRKAFYSALIAVGIAVIVFSSRRNAWLGLTLAGLYFILTQPARQRLLSVGVMAAVGAVVGYVAQERLGTLGGGGLGSLVYDITRGGAVSLYGGRFQELAQALETIRNNPILGVGAWGEFAGYGIDYHQGSYGFVHSGFVHVLLKTGLVGLTIFLGIFVGFASFVLRRRSAIDSAYRPLFDAAFGGFLFLLPSLSVATPVIEYRTMLMLGIVLSLPYCAHWVQQRSRARNTGEPCPAAS